MYGNLLISLKGVKPSFSGADVSEMTLYEAILVVWKSSSTEAKERFSWRKARLIEECEFEQDKHSINTEFNRISR
jgi:hypothetical protein